MWRFGFREMLISDFTSRSGSNGGEAGYKPPAWCEEKEKKASDLFDVVMELDGKILLLLSTRIAVCFPCYGVRNLTAPKDMGHHLHTKPPGIFLEPEFTLPSSFLQTETCSAFKSESSSACNICRSEWLSHIVNMETTRWEDSNGKANFLRYEEGRVFHTSQLRYSLCTLKGWGHSIMHTIPVQDQV